MSFRILKPGGSRAGRLSDFIRGLYALGRLLSILQARLILFSLSTLPLNSDRRVDMRQEKETSAYLPNNLRMVVDAASPTPEICGNTLKLKPRGGHLKLLQWQKSSIIRVIAIGGGYFLPLVTSMSSTTKPKCNGAPNLI